MSGHRHTAAGHKVLAVFSADPDVVVETNHLGAVLVCLDMQTHPDGDFVVLVNGGSIPGDGLDPARFINPLEAFECASAIARDVFMNWIHEQGHNPGPLEQDADVEVDGDLLRYGPDPMGDHHGRNQ